MDTPPSETRKWSQRLPAGCETHRVATEPNARGTDGRRPSLRKLQLEEPLVQEQLKALEVAGFGGFGFVFRVEVAGFAEASLFFGEHFMAFPGPCQIWLVLSEALLCLGGFYVSVLWYRKVGD